MKPLLLLVAMGIASSLPAQQPVPVGMESVTSRDHLDRTVHACTDFSQYANGAWLRNNPIPPTEVSWGIQNENYRSVAATLDSIFVHAAQNYPSARDHATRTLGIHYSSCMDSSAIERLGWSPIAAQLRRIESMRTRRDVESEIARLQKQYVLVPFVLNSASDPGDTQMLIARLARARLPLSDRGNYLRQDSASVELRGRYVRHIAALLRLAGRDSGEANASALHALSVESALAEAAYTAVERRDPLLIHNKMSMAELQRLMPGFAWPRFLRAMGRPDIQVVDVENPRQMRAVDAILATRSVEVWRAYLSWVVVRSAAPNLSTPFMTESARFGRELNGATEAVPRARRCADVYLPQLLDQKFLEARFSARALTLVRDVAKNVAEAFRARIQRLTWMGDATKQQALAKLEAVTFEIGFPSKWIDLSALRLRPGHFYANTVATLGALHAGDMSRIGQSDAGTWPIQASDGDKYNWGNRILLPAGGLQPPLFDPSGDDAANYGVLGAVIGHELTHSFDEHGAAFDARNNLRNWWTPTDLGNFRQRAALMVRQFDEYTVLDSLHVNGKLTLNENIADYGGVSMAYDAFKDTMRGRGAGVLKDGFTPDQRFFVAYARSWAGAMRPEAQRAQLQTALHAPRQWRINGPLSNMPEFAAAFGCKPGDAMVRPDSLRPLIW